MVLSGEVYYFVPSRERIRRQLFRFRDREKRYGCGDVLILAWIVN